MTDMNQDIGVAEADPLYGGDTARITAKITDQTDSALDLSSAQTVEFEVFDELGGTSQLKKTDSDSDVTVTGANNNVVTIDLTTADTAALAPDRHANDYEYRIRVTDADGDTDTTTTGALIVRAG